MEAVEVELHTFLTSAPDTVERSIAHHMGAVEVQLHTFLNSIPDTVERPTAYLMEAVVRDPHSLNLNTRYS
jgi:hypothetical protein